MKLPSINYAAMTGTPAQQESAARFCQKVSEKEQQAREWWRNVDRIGLRLLEFKRVVWAVVPVGFAWTVQITEDAIRISVWPVEQPKRALSVADPDFSTAVRLLKGTDWNAARTSRK